MRVLERIADFIDIFNDRFGDKVSYILIPLFLFVLIAVIMRYVFNNPIPAGFEVAGLICGAYTMLAGAWVLLKQGHVRMEILFNRLSPRGQAIMDIVTSVLFFIFAVAFMYAALNTATKSISVMETSYSGIDVPYWPVKLMMPIGGALLLLQGFSKLLRDILVVVKGGSQS